MTKEIKASELLEDLIYSNNKVRSLNDKIKYYEKKIEQNTQADGAAVEFSALLTKREQVKQELLIMYGRRTVIRNKIDELFNSLKG